MDGDLSGGEASGRYGLCLLLAEELHRNPGHLSPAVRDARSVVPELRSPVTATLSFAAVSFASAECSGNRAYQKEREHLSFSHSV